MIIAFSSPNGLQNGAESQSEMSNKFCHKNKISISTALPKIGISLLACAMLAAEAIALPAPPSDWIENGPDADNSGIIYMSTTFVPVSGKFRSIPAKPMLGLTYVEGDFVTGELRFVPATPTTESDGLTYDELISSSILDCKNHYYAAVKNTKKFQGKVILEETKSPDQIIMMQTKAKTLDRDLCDLRRKLQRQVRKPR